MSRRETRLEVTAAQHFAIIPEWVLYAAISDRAVRLYGVMRRLADYQTGVIKETTRTKLARRLDCSIRTLDRALIELRHIGALTVEHCLSDEGDYDTNRYTVHTQPTRNTPDTETPVTRGGDTRDATPTTPVTGGGVTDGRGVVSPVAGGGVTDGKRLSEKNSEKTLSDSARARIMLEAFATSQGITATPAWYRQHTKHALAAGELLANVDDDNLAEFAQWAITQGCRTPAGLQHFAGDWAHTTRPTAGPQIETCPDTAGCEGRTWVPDPDNPSVMRPCPNCRAAWPKEQAHG